jgi:endonuclease YncB( thermonuclease family)
MTGLMFLRACWAYSGTVVEVPAGDVLRVAVADSVQTVRLYGISCPVLGQPFHEKAQFLTNNLALRKKVEITPVFKDANGIDNVLVRIEGVVDFLNNQLIGYGVAWVRPCDSKSRLCEQWKKQEEFAQMNFIGLWAQPPAIAPWEWQNAVRMQIYEKGMESRKPQK